MTESRWRVGQHYGIHVYEDDRPVATFARAEDAAEAVRHVNAVRERTESDQRFLANLRAAQAGVGNDGLTDAERAEFAEQWRTGAGALPSAEASRRAAVALGIDTTAKEN